MGELTKSDKTVDGIVGFGQQKMLVIFQLASHGVASNVNDVFPLVSLNLAGGASMILSPPDYLMLQNSFDGNGLWCIGFQMRRGQGITILGGQHLGWTNYDYKYPYLSSTIVVSPIGWEITGGFTLPTGSSLVNVSLGTNTGKSENEDPRRMRNGTSREVVCYNMT